MGFGRFETGIQGLCLIKPDVFPDERGCFLEGYNKEAHTALGITTNFVQDNLSFSKKGVLRGLHRQIMFPQAKLVRVVKGLIYDVAVDIRKGSPTYGKSYGTLLCGPMDPEAKDYNLAFYIPENFLHGFLVLSDNVVFWYKVNDYYHSNDEGGIIWNDPDLNIEWPLEKYGLTVDDIILSDKDKNAKRFSEVL